MRGFTREYPKRVRELSPAANSTVARTGPDPGDTGGIAVTPTAVWTAKTGVPFEEELLDLIVRPEFAAQNREALRAFLADFVAATRYYLDHTEEAKLALVDKGYVQTPPEVYVKLADYYREPTGRVTLEGLEQEQDLHLKLGWQRTKLNVRDPVDMSLLPQ